eukprot:UC4_evm2s302
MSKRTADDAFASDAVNERNLTQRIDTNTNHSPLATSPGALKRPRDLDDDRQSDSRPQKRLSTSEQEQNETKTPQPTLYELILGLEGAGEHDYVIKDTIQVLRNVQDNQASAQDAADHVALLDQDVLRTRDEEQGKAVNAIIQHFQQSDTNTRAQIEVACGVGKTHIAMLAAERYVEKNQCFENGGVILLLEPTLALIKQTAQRWHKHSKHRDKYDVMTVCSDAGVIELDDDNGAVETLQDMNATEYEKAQPDNWKRVLRVEKNGQTDAERDGQRTEDMLDFLDDIKDDRPIKLVFATYQSAHVIQHAYELSRADTALHDGHSLARFDPQREHSTPQKAIYRAR